MVDDTRVRPDVPIFALAACLVAGLPPDPAGEGAAAEAPPGGPPDTAAHNPPGRLPGEPPDTAAHNPPGPPPGGPPGTRAHQDPGPPRGEPPSPPGEQTGACPGERSGLSGAACSAAGPQGPAGIESTPGSLPASREAAHMLVGLLPFIHSVLRRSGVPAKDVPDVAQSLLLDLLPWATRLEPDEARAPCPTCRGYIRVAATRSAWGHLKREARRGETLGWTPPGPAHEGDDGLAPAPSPEDLLLEHEAAARLAAELDLDRLSRATSPACWRAFLAYHVTGTPVAEIAEAELAPIATIYNRLRIARRDLRAAILRRRAAGHGQ